VKNQILNLLKNNRTLPFYKYSAALRGQIGIIFHQVLKVILSVRLEFMIG